jgi:ribosomal protein S18 acetylase RimI-like enzyme
VDLPHERRIHVRWAITEEWRVPEIEAALFERIGSAATDENKRRGMRPMVIRVDVADPEPWVVVAHERNGYEATVVEDDMAAPRMSRADEQRLPGAIHGWSAATAPLFYHVYTDAFADRPGFPGWSFETWRGVFSEIQGFRADLTFLVTRDDGPLAYALLAMRDAEGGVLQMGVAHAARRQGIGRSVLVEAMRRLYDAGASSVRLSVAANNDPARRLYERVGFTAFRRNVSFQKRIS